MDKVCSVCGGAKIIGQPPAAQACPLCGGTGKEWDPGEVEWLTGQFIIGAGNGVLNGQTISMPDNRPFRWIFAMAVSTGAFTVQITDASTQKKFVAFGTGGAGGTGQIHRDLIFGTAQNPFPLPTPFVFKKQILLDFTDISAAANTINVAFGGVLLAP